MFIESLTLTNFRCFGASSETIRFQSSMTALIGANGTGKTAVMYALQRLFGVTSEQRRPRRHDFHVPPAEPAPPSQRQFALEAILAFPELEADATSLQAVPEFFHQMATEVDGGKLKCRLRLDATWTDDGSLEGSIELRYRAIRAFGDYSEDDCVELKVSDRARIQLIYVPATRDGASQLASFLKGRLWRAVKWSQTLRGSFENSGATLTRDFASEPAVGTIASAVKQRWQEIHCAGTHATPNFRPIDLQFEGFIHNVGVFFLPDEVGHDRALEDLSDGQRSLFHLALTASTLDVEAKLAANPDLPGFQGANVALPALTIIAVEEPENNLAPFYLGRIMAQIEHLTVGHRAQAVVSSHSPSILTRVDPRHVRHFRLEPSARTARVRTITLPPDGNEAAKFVREAVQSYPELYFARFVVLGEGASEEVVLPLLAKSMNLDIDRSFVAVVPLGGRHVNHFWRLLRDLDIPHATLLDLDWGRSGGGWGRIKTTCEHLIANGENPLSGEMNTSQFDTYDTQDFNFLLQWVAWLNNFNVFFCTPLDLDYSMLEALPDAYRVVEPGKRGPSHQGDPRLNVLGEDGRPDLYPNSVDSMRWYRYLFLGRGKPSTHVQALSSQELAVLAQSVPRELSALLRSIVARLAVTQEQR